ncbi:MAG: hypothetical protein OXH31_06435 [Gammaproteobacteria bacterium]|nr:hypothetical protein [Gammaproteobacteria bacterium]
MASSKTNSISSFVLGVLTTVLLFGAGFLAYKFLVHSSSLTPVADETNISTNFDEEIYLSEFSDSVEIDISELPETESNYARSVALRAMLASSDETALLALLEQSKNISNEYLRSTTQSEILRRYASLNPSEAITQISKFSWNDRKILVTAVFHELATTDIESAISHLRTLEQSDHRLAFAAILSVRRGVPDSRVNELASELDLDTVTVDVQEQSILAQALKDPESAWNAILGDGRNDENQVLVLATILETWLMQDGSTVIEQIENSLAHLSFPQSVLVPVFSQWARSDPDSAFEAAHQLTSNAMSDVTASVLQTWTSTDPKAALEALSAIDSAEERTQFQQQIAYHWARENPRELFDSLKTFPSTVRSLARSQALRGLATEEPLEAIRLLGNSISSYEVGDSIIGPWAEKDVHSALEWVLSKNRNRRHDYLWSIWPSLVREDPELALETAINQPVSRNKVAFEPQVIRHLARIDIDQAIAMLPRVRDVAKVPSFAEAGHELLKRNEPERAIELVLQLPPAQHDDYFVHLFNQWQNEDKYGLFESLDLFPTAEIKSRAALVLLQGYTTKSYKLFSDDQIAIIKSYLSDKHSKSLLQYRRW